MTRAVLFDLDGTLADTAQDLGAALNRLLQEHGKSPLPYASIRPVASHGARGLINLGFGIDRDHPEFESLRQRFLDHYDTGFADLTSI
ncbi:MAG: HAD hydrolase-like protein, partial [Burkholderiales bacterium]